MHAVDNLCLHHAHNGCVDHLYICFHNCTLSIVLDAFQYIMCVRSTRTYTEVDSLRADPRNVATILESVNTTLSEQYGGPDRGGNEVVLKYKAMMNVLFESSWKNNQFVAKPSPIQALVEQVLVCTSGTFVSV